MEKYYIINDIERDGKYLTNEWDIEELRRYDNGDLVITDFVYLPGFIPESHLLYGNPILGTQYVDLMAEFNRAGNHHPLAMILRGEVPPNGQKINVYNINPEKPEMWKLSHSIIIRYDSIFDFGFITSGGQEYRGTDKLESLQRAIANERT